MGGLENPPKHAYVIFGPLETILVTGIDLLSIYLHYSYVLVYVHIVALHYREITLEEVQAFRKKIQEFFKNENNIVLLTKLL